MPAPIQRFSDSRLIGNILVKPFNYVFQWTKAVKNPIYPNSKKITEIALKVFKLIVGSAALLALSLPALIGRALQITHFTYLGKALRESPKPVSVDGISLPKVRESLPSEQECSLILDEKSIVKVLRNGLNALPEIERKTTRVVKSTDRHVLTVSFHLLKGEACIISRDTTFEEQIKASKNGEALLKQLILENGYRAVKRSEGQWKIFDSSCVSILGNL